MLRRTVFRNLSPQSAQHKITSNWAEAILTTCAPLAGEKKTNFRRRFKACTFYKHKTNLEIRVLNTYNYNKNYCGLQAQMAKTCIKNKSYTHSQVSVCIHSYWQKTSTSTNENMDRPAVVLTAVAVKLDPVAVKWHTIGVGIPGIRAWTTQPLTTPSQQPKQNFGLL